MRRIADYLFGDAWCLFVHTLVRPQITRRGPWDYCCSKCGRDWLP